MDLDESTDRLFLRPEVVFFRTAGGVEVHGPKGRAALQGPAYYDLLLTVAPYLDGRFAFAQLCRTAPPAARDRIASLLEWLVGKEFAQALPAPMPAGARGAPRRIPGLDPLTAAISPEPPEKAWVRGCGRFALATVHCLARLGVNEIHVCQSALLRRRLEAYDLHSVVILREHRKDHFQRAFLREGGPLVIAFDAPAELPVGDDLPISPDHHTILIGALGASAFAGPLRRPRGRDCLLAALARARREGGHSGAPSAPPAPLTAGLLAQEAALSVLARGLRPPTEDLSDNLLMHIDGATMTTQLIAYRIGPQADSTAT